MRANKLIFMLLSFVWMFFSCAKDDDKELFPTYADRDWWEIKDEPGVLNQLRYSIYKEFGVRVYVNDTLGVERRGNDAYGNPTYHVEKIRPGYSVDGFAGQNYCLSRDTQSLIRTIELLRDHVLRNSSNKNVFCYLICDTAYMKYNMIERPEDVVRLPMSTLISSYDMASKSEEEQNYCGAKLLSKSIYGHFDSLTMEKVDTFNMISTTGAGASYRFKDEFPETTLPDLYKRGFIKPIYMGIHSKEAYSSQGYVEILYPSRSEDVIEFVAQVMAYPKDKFVMKWEDYPLIVEKYEKMREIVEMYNPGLLPDK